MNTVAYALLTSPLSLWHSRLGHVLVDRLRSLVSTIRLEYVKSEHISCLSCQQGRQPTLLFNKSVSISYVPFYLIHFDVWGPSPRSTMGGLNTLLFFR